MGKTCERVAGNQPPYCIEDEDSMWGDIFPTCLLPKHRVVSASQVVYHRLGNRGMRDLDSLSKARKELLLGQREGRMEKT